MKSEKVTINLSAVELAQIDFLVEKGLYASRSDFIRLATRKQTGEHQKEIEKFVDPENIGITAVTLGAITSNYLWSLGAAFLNQDYVEDVLAAGKTLDIRVIGLFTVNKNVEPEKFKQVLKRIKVFGKINAEPEIKQIIEEFVQDN